MSDGDMLGVGVSGLQAFQRSLTTIGQNISNVNTEGYSRQRVNLTARYPSPSGNGFVGNGVKAIATERLFSEYSTDQVRQRTATASSFNVLSEFASQVDNLVADPDAGLSPAINDFFDSLQEVSDDPASIPARNVLLTNAESLVDRFATMDSWLSNLQKAVNDKIVNEVSTINEVASAIAGLNKDIIVARGIGGGQDPNDLLDKRDKLVNDLSESLSVRTVKADDGSINIFVGNGQSLVLGTKTMKLTAIDNPDDPQNKDIGYVNPVTGAAGSVTSMLTGGDLGGILTFRKEVLQPSINSLGRLALGISTTFNALHEQGQDLNGQLGQDFFGGFTEIPSLITGNPNVVQLYATEGVNNTSPALITVGLGDVTNVSTDEYQLSTDGASYYLKNLSTNDIQTLTVSAAGPPFEFNTVDGLEIQLDSSPAIGDVFFIRPTRNPSGQINVAITDPNLIAAAEPIKTNANYVINRGSASISEATIIDINNANLLDTVKIVYSSSTGGTVADQFTIVDSANVAIPAGQITSPAGAQPYAYSSSAGALIEVNGWQVQLSGEAFDGDEFVVEQNASGVSDNRNALALGNLQSAGTMIGGNASYGDAYSELVVLVGNKTRQAEVSYEAQNALLAQAKSLRDDLSGVNLDEEAANLLKFQQSYAAAAQVISIADQIFQTLINAIRR